MLSLGTATIFDDSDVTFTKPPPYDDDDECDESLRRSVIIKAPSSPKVNVMKLLFENNKRSGGGPIENVQALDGRQVLITFKDEKGSSHDTILYLSALYTDFM